MMKELAGSIVILAGAIMISAALVGEAMDRNGSYPVVYVGGAAAGLFGVFMILSRPADGQSGSGH